MAGSDALACAVNSGGGGKVSSSESRTSSSGSIAGVPSGISISSRSSRASVVKLVANPRRKSPRRPIPSTGLPAMSGSPILTGPQTASPAMHETNPSVHLVARPSLDLDGIRAYLEDVGGTAWLDMRTGDGDAQPNPGELLVEFAGRACYRSWEPGLNPNVTRIRTDQREYMENLLRSLHGSVLEHANYSFAFRNVSRVFTHELVRHRAGSAFSQESLRYVRLTDIGFRVPPVLEPIREQVVSLVEQLEEFQVSAADALGLDDEGVPFAVKKEVTSALRRLAPIGLSTDI